MTETTVCQGHRCDHCYVCTHLGVCCMTLKKSEKAALLVDAQSHTLTALQVRMAELRDIWGDLSRMKVRPQQIQGAEPFTRPTPPVLPSAKTPLALPPGPMPITEHLRKDTVQ